MIEMGKLVSRLLPAPPICEGAKMDKIILPA
jgi:hypothetical protein